MKPSRSPKNGLGRMSSITECPFLRKFGAAMPFLCITMSISIALAILTPPAAIYAQNKITKTDIALEAVWLGLHFVDYKQTQNIVSRRDEGYYETNFILGKHPSHGEVNIYFAISTIAQIYIAWMLPKEYNLYGITLYPRLMFQSLYLGASGHCVYHNYRAGLKVKF